MGQGISLKFRTNAKRENTLNVPFAFQWRSLREKGLVDLKNSWKEKICPSFFIGHAFSFGNGKDINGKWLLNNAFLPVDFLNEKRASKLFNYDFHYFLSIFANKRLRNFFSNFFQIFNLYSKICIISCSFFFLFRILIGMCLH